MEYSTDFEKYGTYLSDEAHLLQGHAERIYFPKGEAQIVSILRDAYSQEIPVTISGGGTGLASSRVPLGGWILATDKMQSIFSLNGEEWKSSRHSP